MNKNGKFIAITLICVGLFGIGSGLSLRLCGIGDWLDKTYLLLIGGGILMSGCSLYKDCVKHMSRASELERRIDMLQHRLRGMHRCAEDEMMLNPTEKNRVKASTLASVQGVIRDILRTEL